jgi:hypothetical protein
MSIRYKWRTRTVRVPRLNPARKAIVHLNNGLVSSRSEFNLVNLHTPPATRTPESDPSKKDIPWLYEWYWKTRKCSFDYKSKINST